MSPKPLTSPAADERLALSEKTSSTDDQRIKGGLSVLWYGDPGPGEVVNRHDGAVGPLSTNGRLFVQGEDSVMAYDAYNGQFLWETKNPGAMRTGVYNAREPGNMAASDDHLFMLLGDECVLVAQFWNALEAGGNICLRNSNCQGEANFMEDDFVPVAVVDDRLGFSKGLGEYVEQPGVGEQGSGGAQHFVIE